MKIAETLLRAAGGRNELFRQSFLSFAGPRGMSLEMKFPGPSPSFLDAVAVAQLEEQTGGVVASPEMRFEVDQEGRWLPYYFRDDYSQEEFFVYSTRDHLLGINLELRRYLIRRAAEWDKRLRELGFLEANRGMEQYPLFKSS